MRQVKFRAWNIADGKMQHNISPLRDKVVYNSDSENVFHIMPASRYNLMEYTGFKDRKGTEIYENDILLLEKFDPGPDDEDIDVNREVIFINGGFHIKEMIDEDYAYCLIDMACMDLTEVIGNRYENPELI